MEELTKEFIAESHDGLERMELCLTELENGPGDSKLVSEIFRAGHTIKGTTDFLGFGRMEKLTHVGESLLGVLRDQKLAVTSELRVTAGLSGRVVRDTAATATMAQRRTENSVSAPHPEVPHGLL